MIFDLRCKGIKANQSHRDTKWRASFSVRRRTNLLKVPIRKQYVNLQKISVRFIENKDRSKAIFPNLKLLKTEKHRKSINDSPLKYLAGQEIINEYKLHIARGKNQSIDTGSPDSSLKTSKTTESYTTGHRKKLGGIVMNFKESRERISSTMKHSMNLGRQTKTQDKLTEVVSNTSSRSRLS